MTEKRKAANPMGGGSGAVNRTGEVQGKDTELKGKGQKTITPTRPQVPCPPVMVLTGLSKPLHHTYTEMLITACRNGVIVVESDEDGLTLLDGRTFRITPEWWGLCASYFIENHGVRKVVVEGRAPDKYFRRYCERKGVKVCRK